MPHRPIIWLCWAFCIYMLRKDAKWHPNLSPILWLPTLWIWRCGSRGLAAWFHGGSPDSETGIYDPAFFLTCTVIGWLVMRRQKINWAAMFRANLWLFIFFGYMAISVLWSSWDVFVSSKRWVSAFGDLTMALVVATNPSGQLAGIITVLRRCAYLLIPFSIVLCKYMPNLGRAPAKHWRSDEWIGVTTHKNCLGMLCMVVGIWVIWELWHLKETRAAMSRKEFRFKLIVLGAYTAMTAYLLNGGGVSRSVTSIMCLIIGTVVFWQLFLWLKSRTRFWQRVATLTVVYMIISPGCQLVFGDSLINLTLYAMGRTPNLTDRPQLWADCIAIGMHNPVLGAGYMGFWNSQNLAEIKIRNTNAPEEAHNGYIEVFLELGLVGVAIFAPVLITGILNAWRKMRVHFELGQLCVMMLVMMYIHNYSESGFPRPTYLTWFGFLLAVINLSPALMNRQPETVPISRGKNFQLPASATG